MHYPLQSQLEHESSMTLFIISIIREILFCRILRNSQIQKRRVKESDDQNVGLTYRQNYKHYFCEKPE